MRGCHGSVSRVVQWREAVGTGRDGSLEERVVDLPPPCPRRRSITAQVNDRSCLPFGWMTRPTECPAVGQRRRTLRCIGRTPGSPRHGGSAPQPSHRADRRSTAGAQRGPRSAAVRRAMRRGEVHQAVPAAVLALSWSIRMRTRSPHSWRSSGGPAFFSLRTQSIPVAVVHGPPAVQADRRLVRAIHWPAGARRRRESNVVEDARSGDLSRWSRSRAVGVLHGLTDGGGSGLRCRQDHGTRPPSPGRAAASRGRRR